MKKELKIAPGIFPMPVLIIATYNEDGTVNVMNAAWGMAQEMNQLKLCLSETHKTFENLKRTKACTVALGTKDLMVESDYFGITSGNNTKDKFAKSNLHATKSTKVEAPIIDEYPICMECKVLDFENDGTLVEVVGVSAEEKYVEADGTINLADMGIISFDPYNNNYYVVGERVGKAFAEGRKIK